MTGLKTQAILFNLLFVLCVFEASALCVHKSHGSLRVSPNSHASRIKLLPKYTPLIKIARKRDWIKVESPYGDGWIWSGSVKNKMDCVAVLNPAQGECPGEEMGKVRKKPLTYREGFKLVKNDFGCSYVKDKRGRFYWINTTQVWPAENAQLLELEGEDEEIVDVD